MFYRFVTLRDDSTTEWLHATITGPYCGSHQQRVHLLEFSAVVNPTLATLVPAECKSVQDPNLSWYGIGDVQDTYSTMQPLPL